MIHTSGKPEQLKNPFPPMPIQPFHPQQNRYYICSFKHWNIYLLNQLGTGMYTKSKYVTANHTESSYHKYLDFLTLPATPKVSTQGSIKPGTQQHLNCSVLVSCFQATVK